MENGRAGVIFDRTMLSGSVGELVGSGRASGIPGTGKETEGLVEHMEWERGKRKENLWLSRQLIALYFPLPVEWASEGRGDVR